MVRRLEAAAFADRPWFECVKYGAGTVAAAAVAVLALGSCWGDIRIERDLDRRGVTVHARFLETWCGKCSTLPVVFTTTSGTVVHADLLVAGEPDDDTVLVRYDPQHPRHVHPTNGVVYDEVFGGAVGVGGVGVCAYALFGFLRVLGGVGVRGARRTVGSAGSVPVSHARVVKP